MVKFIDDKGRIFGKVNIIDAFALLLIGLFVFSILNFFSASSRSKRLQNEMEEQRGHRSIGLLIKEYDEIKDKIKIEIPRLKEELDSTRRDRDRWKKLYQDKNNQVKILLKEHNRLRVYFE